MHVYKHEASLNLIDRHFISQDCHRIKKFQTLRGICLNCDRSIFLSARKLWADNNIRDAQCRHGFRRNAKWGGSVFFLPAKSIGESTRRRAGSETFRRLSDFYLSKFYHLNFQIDPKKSMGVPEESVVWSGGEDGRFSDVPATRLGLCEWARITVGLFHLSDIGTCTYDYPVPCQHCWCSE